MKSSQQTVEKEESGTEEEEEEEEEEEGELFTHFRLRLHAVLMDKVVSFLIFFSPLG